MTRRRKKRSLQSAQRVKCSIDKTPQSMIFAVDVRKRNREPSPWSEKIAVFNGSLRNAH